MSDEYSIRINRRDGIVEVSGPDKAWIAAQVEKLASVYGRPLDAENGGDESGGKPAPTRKKSTAAARNQGASGASGAKRKATSSTAKASLDDEIKAKLDSSTKTKLAEFVKARQAAFDKSKQQQAVIVATFLQDELAVSPMTIDAMYTVFSTMGWPMPPNPRQLLIDARRRNGFFSGISDGGVQLTHKGENFGRIDAKNESS